MSPPPAHESGLTVQVGDLTRTTPTEGDRCDELAFRLSNTERLFELDQQVRLELDATAAELKKKIRAIESDIAKENREIATDQDRIKEKKAEQARLVAEFGHPFEAIQSGINRLESTIFFTRSRIAADEAALKKTKAALDEIPAKIEEVEKDLTLHGAEIVKLKQELKRCPKAQPPLVIPPFRPSEGGIVPPLTFPAQPGTPLFVGTLTPGEGEEAIVV